MKYFFRRRLVKILCVVVILLLLGGGGFYSIRYMTFYFSTPQINGPSVFTYAPLDGVSISIEQDHYSSDVERINYTISYNTREEWDVLHEARLELWEEDAWQNLQQVELLTTTDVLVKLGPGATHLSGLPCFIYGPRLRPGHYRIVVPLGDDGGYAAAEFDIV